MAGDRDALGSQCAAAIAQSLADPSFDLVPNLSPQFWIRRWCQRRPNLDPLSAAWVLAPAGSVLGRRRHAGSMPSATNTSSAKAVASTGGEARSRPISRAT
jgi:hypothetical protein